MSIRIFAILAILSVGLVAIKLLSISDGLLATINPVQPAWAAAEPKNSKPKASVKRSIPDITAEPEVTEAKACKAPGFAEQAGLSEQELRVVMRLSQRREELDTRESDLATREAVITLSETQLDDRLQRIESAIAKYDQRIDLLDEQEEARMAVVVKTYEAMKAKSAASIFNTLDEEILLQVATRMKPQAMAKVLAAMNTIKASQLTVQMAKQFSKPDSAEALLGEQQPLGG
jgi:flagellar motility protein MotE (MotC chaperone)